MPAPKAITYKPLEISDLVDEVARLIAEAKIAFPVRDSLTVILEARFQFSDAAGKASATVLEQMKVPAKSTSNRTVI